jgi:hypothetical protein
MMWHDAIAYISKKAASKQMTNRDAAGLILFARAAQRLLEAHADPLNIAPSMAFDWYRNALLALGWAKRGDRFLMTDHWQKQPYVDSGQLMAELQSLASMLDAQHVPFKMLRNPQGDAAAYKSLALDAYHLMQKIDPLSADAHGSPPVASKPASSPGKPKHPHRPKHHQDVMPPEDAAPAPAVVQPPPLVVNHPDVGPVAITPPVVQVAPVMAPPSGGNASAVPQPGDVAPVVVKPPPLQIPPLVPGGAASAVQPPPMVADVPVVPHPDDGDPGQPGDWYWNKHEHDFDNQLVRPEPPGKVKKPKPKKPEPAGGGDAAGILLLLVVLAFS